MDNKLTYRIVVKGLVQGVGFRPFIYHLAHGFSLKGFVENHNEGVIIEVNTSENALKNFCEKIDNNKPIAAKVTHITYQKVAFTQYDKFEIKKSQNTSTKITRICPDICICSSCLNDLKTQKHRRNYPFINCTNCGPRFSIIKDLPYDRGQTTMQRFAMCETCRAEYQNINDRRFHAQPVACNHCGPRYKLKTGDKIVDDYEEILNLTATLLKKGKIIAVKGVGGFYLMCDAFNKETVKLLRERKQREQKPFAVLFAHTNEVKKYANLSPRQEDLLTHWARPIVLLAYKKISGRSTAFNPFISNGLSTIGVMLPYTAFHYHVFEKLSSKAAFILTSANVSDEPIITKNSEAQEKLDKIADAFLLYNRKIYNRVDDSVGMVVNEKPRLLRRSRGYVPMPLESEKLSVEGIVATGAELANSFAMGRGNEVFQSQHIGDLKNLETYEFYVEAINRFEKLFRINKKVIVTDLHPDYLSTKWGEEAAKNNRIPIIKVQHHHAHIAACMAENHLDEKVIGLSFDGTGLGTDNTIWGGEFLLADLVDFERVCYLEPHPLPGGDKASKEPWRMAIAVLHKTFDKDYLKLDLPLFQRIDRQKVEMVVSMIETRVNSPLTTSLGRMFDAVAAICHLCYTNTFQAQAPMLLESFTDETITDAYPYTFVNNTLSFQPMIRTLVKDVTSSVPIEVIATKFHNTVVSSSMEVIKQISKKSGIKKVALSGGVFQNKYLLEKLEKAITSNGLEVFSHSRVPSNDGGITLGQMLIAAKRRQLNLL